MVSTVNESFFHEQFAPWGHDHLQSCHWLQFQAANGLAIPYIGYLKLDVILCGKKIPTCGILVVKDLSSIESSVPWDECHLPLLPTAFWATWAFLLQPPGSHPVSWSCGLAALPPGHHSAQ